MSQETAYLATELKQNVDAEPGQGAADADADIALVMPTGEMCTVSRRVGSISNLITEDPHASSFQMDATKVRTFESLQDVVKYMEYHNGVPAASILKPLRSKLMSDACEDKWDADFIDRYDTNKQALYDLILTADYLKIQGLRELGCAKVASFIKGQPIEKIKDILQDGAKPLV